MFYEVNLKNHKENANYHSVILQ